MGARYYEPNSGRLLSPDPLGHDASLSLYDYCGGDGVNGLDPDGRCPEKLGTAGGMIFSAIFGGTASYIGVNASSDAGVYTDTQNLSPDQQLNYNRQISTLTEAAQGTFFALAGAVTPYNNISQSMRFDEGDGAPEPPQETLEVGGALREPGNVPSKVYHYTLEKNVEGILENGLALRDGKIFTTPNGVLAPIQAQIGLGLSPNRGLPTALLEIDAEGLEAAGIRPKFGPVRVQPTRTSPGSEEEIIYEEDIPREFLKRIQ